MPNHDYAVTYVHKISQVPSDTDRALVTAEPTDLADPKALGACLRRQGILSKGEAVRGMRTEDDGKIVVFPPRGSVWHALILRPHPPTVTLEARCPCCERPMKVYQRPTRSGYFQKDDVDTCETCTSPIRLKDGAIVRRYE